MIYLIKTVLALFLLSWSALGVWMTIKYATLFGPHEDHMYETPGERSFGVAHIGAVWVGIFALTLYFLFK